MKNPTTRQLIERCRTQKELDEIYDKVKSNSISLSMSYKNAKKRIFNNNRIRSADEPT